MRRQPYNAGMKQFSAWVALLALSLAVTTANASPSAIEQRIAQGDFTNALLLCEQQLADDPHNASVLFLKGVTLAKLQRPDGAAAIFEALTARYPGSPEPANNLAVVLTQMQRQDDALRVLRELVQRHPGYAPAHDNLARLHAGMGQTPVTTSAITPRLPSQGPAAAMSTIEAWRSDWQAGRVQAYLAHYADDFRPDQNTTHAQWMAQRRARVRPDASRRIQLSDFSTQTLSDNSVRVSMTQRYQSARYSDTVRKQLTLRQTAGGWKITQERSQ